MALIETILDRGVRRGQEVKVVVPVESFQKAIITGVDLEDETVTVSLTIPASWVREA